MVLSRRATAANQAGLSSFVFTGSKDDNVTKFFFYYENVVMRAKSDDQKAAELLAYLDGKTFDFYYENFGRDGQLLETAMDYNHVKDVITARFSEEVEPDQLIHDAVSTRLSCDEMEESLRSLDLPYERAGFNEQAKFGLLPSAVMEHMELAQFSILRGVVSYDDLKKVIKDFVNGKKAFQSFKNSSKEAFTQPPRTDRTSVTFGDKIPKRILARPDARSNQLERKVDALAHQLSELTLLVKKKQAPTKPHSDGQGRTCSFCRKEGHGASQCDANPHKNTICPRCQKRGHSESTCWARITREWTRQIDPRLIRSESETEMKLAAIAQREDEENAAESHVSVVAEVNEDTEPSDASSDKDLVAAAKRTADGQAVPKLAKTSHDVQDEPLLLKHRIYPSFAHVPVKNTHRQGSKMRRRQKKKTKSRKDLQENSPQYHVISELANAPSGLTFCQLIRGDADDARRELQCLLKGSSRARRTLAVSVGSLVHRLKVVTVRIFGTNAQALLDSGAVPNLISTKLTSLLGLHPVLLQGKSPLQMIHGRYALVL